MRKVEMRQIAQRLAQANVEADETVQKVLWFPDKEEVRLVEVLPDVVKSRSVVAFHFGPDRPGGIPVPSAIALVRPQEVGLIPLPKDWGRWDDAEELRLALPAKR